MFLFESISWQAGLMWFAVLGALILLNELARMSKWTSLILFLLLPIVLSFFVWPKTAVEGTSVDTWFHWAKVYSVLIACVGFTAIRYSERLAGKKWVLVFPPLILAVNILEAVIRDFECYAYNGVVDGITIIGGPWNIMNGIAGILNIILISGWFGIFISKGKKKDMLWPDMLWFWIIAYDLWNFAYIYNAIPIHAFYAGAALLLSCTIPVFLIQKGAWIQNRAFTLGIWMMFVMALPSFQDDSIFTVESSHDPRALFLVSFLALAANAAVFVYQYYKVFKYKKNPLKDDLHTDLKAYQEIAAYKEA